MPTLPRERGTNQANMPGVWPTQGGTATPTPTARCRSSLVLRPSIQPQQRHCSYWTVARWPWWSNWGQMSVKYLTRKKIACASQPRINPISSGWMRGLRLAFLKNRSPHGAPGDMPPAYDLWISQVLYGWMDGMAGGAEKKTRSLGWWASIPLSCPT